MMVSMRCLIMMVVTLALAGCGGGAAATPSSPRAIDEMRSESIRLLFADANATALPRAYDRAVVLKRMRRYVARDWLNRRVNQTVAAIAKVGGRRFFQPWTESITVGRWDGEEVTGNSGAVTYLGYDTICPSAGPADQPMQRVTVQMVRERGRWRLANYESRWLTGAGPMGVSGKLTIRTLPERAVYRNPRPRRWRYLGPHLPQLTPCR